MQIKDEAKKNQDELTETMFNLRLLTSHNFSDSSSSGTLYITFSGSFWCEIMKCFGPVAAVSRGLLKRQHACTSPHAPDEHQVDAACPS